MEDAPAGDTEVKAIADADAPAVQSVPAVVQKDVKEEEEVRWVLPAGGKLTARAPS